MPDTVATLSTTLQAQIAGGGPTAGTMTQLYQALMTGLGAMLASRTNRRIGLLNIAAGGQWDVYIDSNVGQVAGNFGEIKEVANLYGSMQGWSSNIARVNDPMVLNMPASVVIGYASQLVTWAGIFEGFETETLPA